MIVPVDETNLLQAATIHSISWKESHRAFCTPDFIETHTPDRQREYLRNKMNNGTKLYMLVEEKPIGVVSVTKGLIEDLYILPDMQNMGYGTKLLLYAVTKGLNEDLYILPICNMGTKLLLYQGFNRGSLYSSRYAKHGLWNEIVTIRSRPMYGYPYAVDP